MFMLLIVSLILVMCHSILFSTEIGGLQLMGIRQLPKVSNEIDYCRAFWLAILVVVVYLGLMASGFILRRKRPRLALEILIVYDDWQRGQLLSHPLPCTTSSSVWRGWTVYAFHQIVDTGTVTFDDDDYVDSILLKYRITVESLIFVQLMYASFGILHEILYCIA